MSLESEHMQRALANVKVPYSSDFVQDIDDVLILSCMEMFANYPGSARDKMCAVLAFAEAQFRRAYEEQLSPRGAREMRDGYVWCATCLAYFQYTHFLPTQRLHDGTCGHE